MSACCSRLTSKENLKPRSASSWWNRRWDGVYSSTASISMRSLGMAVVSRQWWHWLPANELIKSSAGSRCHKTLGGHRPPLQSLQNVCTALCLLAMSLCANAATRITAAGIDVANAQVPAWSEADMKFFLHGSMSTEVVPEVVLRAFIKIYPDLFP